MEMHKIEKKIFLTYIKCLILVLKHADSKVLTIAVGKEDYFG